MNPSRYIAAIVVLICGCNLAFDTDNYEYTPVPMIGEPRLVITEVLAWTSTVGPATQDERGEFIEIKNVGTAPADPRTITIEIRAEENGEPIQSISVAQPNSPEAIDAVNAIEPMEPGDYFVFIRYETDETPVSSLLEAGSYYDYGKHGTRVELSQSQPRFLELVYFDSQKQEITSHDQVRWEENRFRLEDGSPIDMELDRSLSLDASAEDPDQNNAGSSWCIESSPVIVNGVAATPGTSAMCR